MTAEKAAGRAHTKELIKHVESIKVIMSSRNIDKALENVRTKLGCTQRVGSNINRFLQSANCFFIYGNVMKCSLRGCTGFMNPMSYLKDLFLDHLNREHNRNHFSESLMLTFVMENGKLRVMSVDQLKIWFEDETERQMNTVPTKLWTEKVYTPWSLTIPDAVDSANFKICTNSDDFNRKFRDSNQSTKWTSVFLVKDSYGLGAVYPDADTLLELLKKEGGDEEITYIDVQQERFPKAKRKEFVELFETPKLKRRTVYNNLQMEISHVKALKDSIVLPEFAREHCMMNELGLGNEPRYERYVILTQAGAFTDFHIDLGGFSNYFHVLKGIKIFYFVEPTDTNLALFEDYFKNHRSEGGLNWFGNKGVEIRKVTLTAGCTSFMPAGWIHAVYTAEDTIAISGSFFESTCIPMHLQVYEHEDNVGLDKLHRVEEFVRVHVKYLVEKLRKTVKENNDNGTPMILTSKLAWNWKSFRKLLAFIDKIKIRNKRCVTEKQFKDCQKEEERQLALQAVLN
ncbi:hypothetical protein CAEBREN_13231 [Caenorhabditis brenneri]|uniref:JmjC domain-containing protein n=1 Tax=Caenorhabditis brenneri TaxID=135651 RepID=G0PF63_CAEBE|nr:hypothetical protein CAEBREN_13231 [Caenorhabditis brenneri]